MCKKLFLSLLLLCLSFCKADGVYTEYWQRFYWKMKECGPFEFGTYVDLRTTNHMENIRYWQISGQLAYEAAKNLELEIHYTYIHEKPLVHVLDPVWEWQQRLELEVNPSFDLPCDIKFKTRNRLEIRVFEHNPETQYRFRQRDQLVFPIKNFGSLKSYSIHNEIFYNLSTHEFNQDRFCPFQLTFSLAKEVDLDVFFIMRYFIEDARWRRSLVFGTYLHF